MRHRTLKSLRLRWRRPGQVSPGSSFKSSGPRHRRGRPRPAGAAGGLGQQRSGLPGRSGRAAESFRAVTRNFGHESRPENAVAIPRQSFRLGDQRLGFSGTGLEQQRRLPACTAVPCRTDDGKATSSFCVRRTRAFGRAPPGRAAKGAAGGPNSSREPHRADWRRSSGRPRRPFYPSVAALNLLPARIPPSYRPSATSPRRPFQVPGISRPD